MSSSRTAKIVPPPPSFLVQRVDRLCCSGSFRLVVNTPRCRRCVPRLPPARYPRSMAIGQPIRMFDAPRVRADRGRAADKSRDRLIVGSGSARSGRRRSLRRREQLPDHAAPAGASRAARRFGCQRRPSARIPRLGVQIRRTVRDPLSEMLRPAPGPRPPASLWPAYPAQIAPNARYVPARPPVSTPRHS